MARGIFRCVERGKIIKRNEKMQQQKKNKQQQQRMDFQNNFLLQDPQRISSNRRDVFMEELSMIRKQKTNLTFKAQCSAIIGQTSTREGRSMDSSLDRQSKELILKAREYLRAK